MKLKRFKIKDTVVFRQKKLIERMGIMPAFDRMLRNLNRTHQLNLSNNVRNGTHKS